MADEQYSPDDYELDRLRAEIEQEKQMKEMLDQSNAELKATVDDLEMDSIEKEGSEWRVRFETQKEMNQQVEQHLLMMQDKVEELRHRILQVVRTPRDSRNFDDSANANPHMVKVLEKERNFLVNQLRDLEWRLDQESKAYHRANDERKRNVAEMNLVNTSLSYQRSKQLASIPESVHTYRDSEGNIPGNQRIIDPRKGPIKKTAGVKNLPGLEDEDDQIF